MSYHVRFNDGSTHDFSDWTQDTTIIQVKESIKTFKLVSHTDLIRLIFGGRILKNQDTLQQCGITTDSTFHCVVRAEPLESPIAPLVTGANTQNTEGGDDVEAGAGLGAGTGNLEELLQTLGLQNMNMDISGDELEGLGLGDLEGGGISEGIGLQFLQQFIQTLRDSSNNIIQQLNDSSSNNITMTIPLVVGNNNDNGEDSTESILGGEHVTPENIQTLIGMGFSDNVDMRIALRLSNGNIQHAVEYLLNL